MKAIMFAERSNYIHFHRDLSTPTMSMSQVGVAIFPSL